MLLKEFRIAHSALIEHYQFIEAHLEGIYAAILDKPFRDGIKEIERDSLSGVVREIRELEQDKRITVFTDEEYKQLRQIIDRRNFWCHCCYFELSFDLKTGALAKVRDVQLLMEDMKTAEAWRELLYNKKLAYLENK